MPEICLGIAGRAWQVSFDLRKRRSRLWESHPRPTHSRGRRESPHGAPPAPTARPTAPTAPTALSDLGEHVSCPTACPTPRPLGGLLAFVPQANVGGYRPGPSAPRWGRAPQRGPRLGASPLPRRSYLWRSSFAAVSDAKLVEAVTRQRDEVTRKTGNPAATRSSSPSGEEAVTPSKNRPTSQAHRFR
jgi:hypothetical protein